MPRIEHVGLWVRDIDAVCSFYATYFGARVGPGYENAAKGFASRFLVFDTGVRIEVMTSSTLSPVLLEPGAQRMGFTHLAVALESETAVDHLTERLRDDGYAVLDGPRRTGDGYYESVVLDPEGNRVEITS